MLCIKLIHQPFYISIGISKYSLPIHSVHNTGTFIVHLHIFKLKVKTLSVFILKFYLYSR